MCLAMNADRLEPGERCASTSNRNFEGRQGAGGRTHLVSPAMAAAAARSRATLWTFANSLDPVSARSHHEPRLSPSSHWRLAFALAGCNTVQGMGQDIERAGQRHLTRAAK